MRNRNRRLFRGALLALFSCVLFSSLGFAQSFVFVSPNTRDHLSDEDAADSLSSFEQANFLAVAKYLAAKICPAPQVFSAEGIYAGNAENSSLITGCPAGKARYLGELLGRYGHQKWILVFDPSTAGQERLLMVEFTTDQPADAIKYARQYNITGATILFQGHVVRLYVWTTDHAQDAAVHALAEAQHGSASEIQGKGTLIGDDDRTAAQRVFDSGIRTYERANRQSFSRLRSKQLHDMVDKPARGALR